MTSEEVAKGSNVGEVDEEEVLNGGTRGSDDVEGVIVMGAGFVIREDQDELASIQ